MSAKTRIGDKNKWRFKQGDKLYVRGWSQKQPVEVTSQEHSVAVFPHYKVQDCVGDYWLISQLSLSLNPIVEDK